MHHDGERKEVTLKRTFNVTFQCLRSKALQFQEMHQYYHHHQSMSTWKEMLHLLIINSNKKNSLRDNVSTIQTLKTPIRITSMTLQQPSPFVLLNQFDDQLSHDYDEMAALQSYTTDVREAAFILHMKKVLPMSIVEISYQYKVVCITLLKNEWFQTTTTT